MASCLFPAEDRNLVIHYWFRTLIDDPDISIQDIAKVILQFGDLYEGFIAWSPDSKLTKGLEISDDSLSFKYKGFQNLCVCGQMDATNGCHFHWRNIKILEISDAQHVNIGILDIRFDSTHSDCFWESEHGWSWYSGKWALWHNDTHYAVKDDDYDDPYTVGDTVDIWLDIKNDNSLAFGKNGKKYNKAFDIDPNETYRLAIASSGYSSDAIASCVELLLLESE